jgi:hypothetical protein
LVTDDRWQPSPPTGAEDRKAGSFTTPWAAMDDFLNDAFRQAATELVHWVQGPVRRLDIGFNRASRTAHRHRSVLRRIVGGGGDLPGHAR